MDDQSSTPLPWADKTACDTYTPSRPIELHNATITSDDHLSVQAVVFPICACGVPYPLHSRVE